MANSPILGWRLPGSTEAPDGPTQMANLAIDAEKYSNMRFPTGAARDAALLPPTLGMKCSIGSGDGMAEYIYNGTSWRATLVDSGWQAITPASGFTSTDARVRVRNGVVYFKGQLAGTLGAAVLIGTCPPGCAPAASSEAIKPCLNDTTRGLIFAVVGGDGTILVVGAPASAATVNLAGLSGYLAASS